MIFKLEQSIEILERTPQVLRLLLSGLSSEWIANNEGPETWSPFDVMGHLIHGEKTDWIPRTEMILAEREQPFPVFDRYAQFEESKGKSMEDLLMEFESLRAESLQKLKSMKIDESDLDKTGIHPGLGYVTLREQLSCWTAHDLGHLAQISRVMAKQYKEEVGPWIQYLGIMK